jgi:nucleotide-binding universal stress UspA family protein
VVAIDDQRGVAGKRPARCKNGIASRKPPPPGLFAGPVADDDHLDADQIERAAIGAHLARHTLNVMVKRMLFGDADVAHMLLSHAADEGADFIVMGGYGNSRLREFVLAT